jgi:hypothetical protein
VVVILFWIYKKVIAIPYLQWYCVDSMEVDTMPQITQRLYPNFYQKPATPEEKRRLQSNISLLKRNFSNWQKKILLRIIDDKDLICAIIAQDSFEQGFRLGIKLMNELYNPKGGISDEDSGMPPLL